MPHARSSTSHAAPAPFSTLLVRSQFALGLGQAALGQLLGVSRSTMGRWQQATRGAVPHAQLVRWAGAVHAADPELAAEIAQAHAQTLESLGIVTPEPPAAPAPHAVAAVPAPPPLHPLVVDSVVCAAAEVLEQPPASLRPVLLAAFERAQLVGLSVDAVVKGLRLGARQAP